MATAGTLLPSLRRTLLGGTVRKRDTRAHAASPAQCVPGPLAGPAERLFFAHRGPVVHKWHNYLPVYDRHFAPFRDRPKDRPLRFLEIGVSEGGSLSLWRAYFGAEALIFGIDVNPACAALDGASGASVRIGSQDDPAFLAKVVAEMGGVDIVLDDGSHMARHIGRSFDVLFPLLSGDGIYVVEDLQCAYWSAFGGGYRRPASFIERAKRLVDDMHHWWHDAGAADPAAAGTVTGVHFYDSILVIDKNGSPSRPVNSKQGG